MPASDGLYSNNSVPFAAGKIVHPSRMLSLLCSSTFLKFFTTLRFEGWFAGAGISYGYQWILGKHWNFEAAIGIGAAYFEYDKFKCGTCGKKIDDGHKIYVGPTKAALTLLYMF